MSPYVLAVLIGALGAAGLFLAFWIGVSFSPRDGREDGDTHSKPAE